MRGIVVAILDSNPFSRTGLRHTLSEQERLRIFSIVECDPGQGGAEAMAQIAEDMPDVVLVDIDYPSLSGLELSKHVARHFPRTKVLMLSANPNDNDAELFEVLKSGAAAYLRSRHCTAAELVETIERTANGEYPINDLVNSRPKLADRVLKQFQGMAMLGRLVEDMVSPITAKELQVLKLIVEGNSNKQIAKDLGISDQTIKHHVSAILRKLNANCRAHAVFIAIREGLISIDPAGFTRNGCYESHSSEHRACITV